MKISEKTKKSLWSIVTAIYFMATISLGLLWTLAGSLCYMCCDPENKPSMISVILSWVYFVIIIGFYDQILDFLMKKNGTYK